MRTALTIAGSDSGGGAGIQADLKTFSAHHVFGMSVITAITAQNTVEVRSVQNIDLTIIRDQIAAVFEDIEVHAVKIGMLSTPEIVETVALNLERYQPSHIVLDPVMISKGGHHLLEENAVQKLISDLIPLATIITPNIPEAEVLASMEIHNEEDMYEASKIIHNKGASSVLLKGGHLEGDANDLYFDGKDFSWFKGKRIPTKNVHGTGCTLSSAIAANLANEQNVIDAIANAKEYITNAIKFSLNIGHGHGPANHFYNLTSTEHAKGSL
ncbi:bifunctional hydroxymethylpyrimidine kinase/phosphomethylpyrimidine kinase [Lederbergia graminis]|uniref:Hydroxymethylpyrimidine/phosphomethylpyrimidine kinase n=1 Tax=Lederbergia graminis TaxID=735518 RepID=A0ABW0LCP8_9BACI